MRMHLPDEKQQRDPSARNNEREESLPGVWRKLLAKPAAAPTHEHVVLGFFFEVMPEEGAPYARLDAAPVLLVPSEHGRFTRPAPLESKLLQHTSLPLHEQRLATALLGLPQTLRKSRSYARLIGHVGNALLADMLDTAPCFLGGLGGLRLSRGRSHQLN